MAKAIITSIASWVATAQAKLAARKERLRVIKELEAYSDADLAGLGLARTDIYSAVKFGR